MQTRGLNIASDESSSKDSTKGYDMEPSGIGQGSS